MTSIPLFKVAMNPNVGQDTTPILTSGFITQGPKVEQFEKRLSEYIGNPYLLTLNSATSGLTLALRLLFKFPDERHECTSSGSIGGASEFKENGLQPGDEVLTTALTCTATNWPILANNLKIKWVDIDRNTGNLNLTDLKNKLSPTTKVIMVVHWGGYPNDLDKLAEIQDYCLTKFGHKPMIIEDCAHAFGAEYKGVKLGNRNICVFSFQAIKHLTTGDGGMITLPCENLYNRAKLLRWYGIDRNARNFNLKDFRLEKDIEEWGYKFHMNDISATIGLSNFDLAISNLEQHRQNASFYFNQLKEVDGLVLMENDTSVNPSWWIYSMKILNNRKQQFIEYMKENGIIASQVHNRNDNHTCVSEFKSNLTELDKLEMELICIPVGWWLTKENLEYIVQKIKEFV